MDPRKLERVKNAPLVALLLAGAGVSNLFAAPVIYGALPHPHVQQALTPAVAVPAAAAPGVLGSRTRIPAEAVLESIATDPGLLAPGWSRVGGGASLFSSPFSHGCGKPLPVGAAPVAVRTVSSAVDTRTATLSLWVYPAGGAGPALSKVREWLDACQGADADLPVVRLTSVAGALGLNASVSTPGRNSTWTVWQRGDVLSALSVNADAAQDPGSLNAMVAASDAAVVKALTPVCAQLAPTVADASRNPYLPGYQPYTVSTAVALPVLALPPPATAPAPVPAPVLPAATAHPDLAPLVPAPASAWQDTNNDGVLDTPPPVANAARGPVPTFRDPDAVVVPPGLSGIAPLRPREPAAPNASLSVAVPTVDPVGPGCGWAFAGSPPPVFDPVATATAAQAAAATALSSAAGALGSFRAAQHLYLNAQTVFLSDQANYGTFRTWLAAKAEASTAQAAAQAAYAASALEYNRPPPSPTPPTRTATATATSTATATATTTATASPTPTVHPPVTLPAPGAAQ